MRMRWSVRCVASVALMAGSAAAPPAVRVPPAATPASTDAPVTKIPLLIDEGARMTVPVKVGADDTLSFLIDTGAERSGIATDVASRLRLPTHRHLNVVGFAGTQKVATVVIPWLQYARVDHRALEALRFDRTAIGADGFLGIDTLGEQMVDFDFKKGVMSIRKASMRRMAPREDAVIVNAQLKAGRLIFASSQLNHVKVDVLLDTGSSLTVGNTALRDKLRAKHKLPRTIPVYMMTITGEIVMADYGVAKEVMIGDVLIRSLPIAFATVEPFRQLGMDQHPALLLGMDALSAFSAVSVDFRNRAVRFVARDEQARTTDVDFSSSKFGPS